uniref:Uncharacterized protein n=1 Tax=Solanum lycopersicum TaxID=4081 RepID=A0A3Q7GA29_SOLLC
MLGMFVMMLYHFVLKELISKEIVTLLYRVSQVCIGCKSDKYILRVSTTIQFSRYFYLKTILAKGKMGASIHRSSRDRGIGGKSNLHT